MKLIGDQKMSEPETRALAQQAWERATALMEWPGAVQNTAQAAARKELGKARNAAKHEHRRLDVRALSPEAAALYRQRRGFDKAWDIAWDSSSALPVDINR